jgi:acyl-CoA dehydrogenase
VTDVAVEKDIGSVVRRIADDVSAAYASEVDRDARFPAESVAALREAGALGAAVPVELGGRGADLAAVAAACFELGRRCGASAMVFAMHNIQVFSILRHLDDAPWFRGYLERVAAEGRLIASATSEVGTGGDLGRSVAPLRPDEAEWVAFEKQAPTVSYGSYADDLFITLRRSVDAEPGDQVIVLAARDQLQLEPMGTWDPLGMRGTCSPGFTIRGRVPREQVLATPFGRVATESMVPISHILWSHLWLGIATDAFDRARAFVREGARRKDGGGPGDQPPPTAIRLSHLLSELSLLRAEVAAGLRAFEDASSDRERLSTLASVLRFNNLKVAAADAAPRICQGAMSVAGIMAYKNDTPFSIGRHLRDTMSACLMVANERIHQTNASLLLIAKDV